MYRTRPARKDEVKKLQALNQEVFVDNQRYDPDLKMDWALGKEGEKYFTNLLNNPKACCLIAEVGKKPIGYIAAAPKLFSYRKSRYIEIENMGVIPSFHHKGIGTTLIRECLNWAKKRGFQKIYVNSYFANHRAINFYKKNGFLEIDISFEREI